MARVLQKVHDAVGETAVNGVSEPTAPEGQSILDAVAAVPVEGGEVDVVAQLRPVHDDVEFGGEEVWQRSDL